ncbi:hypothetical protein ACP275_04G194000 [Erythranthe tilingii]
MDTLRVFTARRKNCYSIRAGKGERVILRVGFYYGNYDNRSSPPSFDIQFDGNNWATVDSSSTQFVFYEVTYVTKRDYVSVCVAQTKRDQFPFISSIEIRGLESTMYSRGDQDYPLHLIKRVAYGTNKVISTTQPLHLIKRVAYGTNKVIRYRDDPYDRVWAPAVRKHGLIDVASDAPHIRTGILDRPPSAVLQNAMTAVDPSDRIKFRLQFPPVNFNIYLSMYFSEVSLLNATTEKRSFQLLIDDEPVLDSPIVPPYGSCLEVYDSNIMVFSNITCALAPMEESTLPPIINAMEIFLIGDLIEDGTDSKDVEGLLILQSAFGVLQDWSGDPCLPKPYSWEWIECSSDPRPRVTALYLSSFDLTGVVPDFSTMDALETIDFHNNTLKGPIPEFLATLPNLKQLNLASNEFSGPVPDSLSKKIGVNLVVTGNPDLCTSGNSCKTFTSSSLTE